MMRSMFAGVSGLKTHQVRMDIIGNNIANVNSAGYKSSRATFQDMLSQTMRAATAPTASSGGTNPHQIGLGVQLGSIDVKHTQGNTQSTGYITDLAIEGEGFFVLGQGENRLYTRAGMFGLDNGTEGNLVSLVNGQRVLGYKADQDGVIDTNSSLEPMYISASETITPRATDTVFFSGNLDNRYSVGESVSRTVQVYDSRGREQTIVVDLTQNGDNEWQWSADWLLVSDSIPMDNDKIVNNGEYKVERSLDPEYDGKLVLFYEVQDPDDPDDPDTPIKEVVAFSDADSVDNSVEGRVWTVAGTNDPAIQFEFEAALEENENMPVYASSDGGRLFLTTRKPVDSGGGTIKFNKDGSFLAVTGNNKLPLNLVNAEDLEIELDFTEFTQYADTFTGKFLGQNGYTSGALESYAIDQNGVIVGSFSNGLTRALGQVALARFANPAGLQRSGGTMFSDTPNSGDAQIGAAGIPGYGQIAPSALEMSNVDLSEEFTEMIITQRGFQANSRIITTSDEMLQELVNLKR